MKQRKVVVTGGLGFIGSHMAERLILDNEVTVVDDGSTGRLENIRHLLPEGLVFTEGDIATLDLAKVFEGKDYVFHLAALPSVPRSIKDPLNTHHANLTGTLNVLTAAKDSGIKKVVFASSSSVYGDTPTLPKSEDMVLNPKSPYAVTKAAGEMYCRVFEEIYGLKTVSLRYFNVFGPRQDPGSPYAAVIPLFIRAVMDGKSPVVFGDGEQSRDFTYVGNVVDASLKACESDMTGSFNVACGRSVTINRLIGMINELLGRDVRPLYVQPRPGDIRHSLADIGKAGRFSYAPSGDFREELKETIRSFGTCLN
jgi:UDP-glucose 4-epimerase